MKKSFDKIMGDSSISNRIKKIADEIGIDVLGFADASEFSNYSLPDSLRRRPALSLPDAKTIIVAGFYIGGLRLPKWENPYWGRTSRLFLSGFFLNVVKPIEPIANYLKDNGYQAIICDSSEEKGSVLPLKLAAVRAGLGWQGKHSLLISKKFGTFLVLGGIITNAALKTNTKEEPNRCGKCTQCQKACPLKALEEPYRLNRSRCLSHHLMAESLPVKATRAMGNRIADCEVCQDACPWNKKHLANPLALKMTKHFQGEIDSLQEVFYLPRLAKLPRLEFEKTFARFNTGIPFDIFHRNVLVAKKNGAKAVGTKDHTKT